MPAQGPPLLQILARPPAKAPRPTPARRGPGVATGVVLSAARASYAEFYQPHDARGPDDAALLLDAAGNGDPPARAAITTRLLADGAQATDETIPKVDAVEIMLGHNRHDFMVEAPVLRRLFDAGVPVNRRVLQQGPVAAAGQGRGGHSRAARPDLKLDVEGFGKGRPVAPNSQGGEDNPEGRALNRRVEIRYEG
ncbi:MAG TPA: hypothetical protein P5314_07170 [Tetrasphaera sp.]|nr:hypothetical protein [Tetrasphaera sp.]